ncbi:MAG: polysaccharide biosynthesis protein [Clostridia bacterium]|nr:polysaccharide biosynthesis protein [Clostridia bacterium]
MEGRDSHKRIRDIKIEDLLFRDTISVTDVNMKKAYSDKVVMITGGGGSIGSELCRQVAKLSPKKLVILDIYENNAYDIQQELQRTYGDKLNLVCEIASIRDAEKIEKVFLKHRPEVVFHAAAHKHVPLMEDCCDEAVKNNVFGTFNVANAAEKAGVGKFIMISTDKAVNPTNIMGATKRLCEMIIQSKKDSATDFAAVRFGNVLGSNGSVIPLFMRQIENGGPVTITDKRIVRYFMTIPEASQLVMQAGASAAKGEIYVLDMGKPMKILSLAENMIRLAGLKPYEDIDIQEVGLRPGEKLYEELLMKTEELDKTDNEKIFIERDCKLTREELNEKLRLVHQALDTGDMEAIRKAMMEVVPTYHDADSVNRDAIHAEEMRAARSEEVILQ